MRLVTIALMLSLPGLDGAARAQDAPPLAEGVRGLVTRASGGVKLDGSLDEWATAYCTPVHYNHADLAERAAQFFYQWDDEALYIGLRSLDTHRADPGAQGAIYDGDAVEFYLDTRPRNALRGKDWTEGAVHLFYSPFEGQALKPRWVIRSGIATSGTKLSGVAVAATVHPWGDEVEFKLPWANFPKFRPEIGALIALDAELCSGDGGGRTDRTFAFGSPLSVQQPASLGLMQLVRNFDPDYLPAAGPASFPMWVETPWTQPKRAEVQAVVAIPPEFVEVVGTVEIRLLDADGKVLKTLPAPIQPFGPEGKDFARAVARWSIDDFAPNTYFATAKVHSRTGKTLVTVTPRMVHEAILSGR